jgi:phage terminase large subunit-like protein
MNMAMSPTPDWNFACPDWIERLQFGRSLVPELPLDWAEAERAVGLFNMLRLPDVPNQPTMAEAAGEWFRDVIRAGFGSLMPRANAQGGAVMARHVGEIFVMVPKKNSKTTGGAGITLTAALMNERPNAELLFVGPTQDVADLAFQQARGMIEADAEGYLQTRFHVREHIKTIEDRTNGAKIKIKTFDTSVMTGVKPVFVLVDELHEMSKRSYATRVVGQIRGGLLPNPEGLLVFITTQSDQPPAGVFKSELEYARGVRDGRIVSRPGAPVKMLPILYEFPEDMQTAEDMPWRAPVNWPMVLPNLGLSINIEDLEAHYAQAKEKGFQEECRWASQHLNVQIGVALGGWRGSYYWSQATDASLTLEALLERSDVVTIGIDGGGLDDLLGLAVIGRCKVTRDWLLWTHAWCQRDVLELRKDIAERLIDFEKQGDLTVCEDATQDVVGVADLVERIWHADLLPAKDGIGLDPACVTAIIDEIVSRGVPDDLLRATRQGAVSMQPAIHGTERKLKNGTFWHGGTPMMAWCVGNAKAEQRGNAVLITKEVAGKAKIDPLMAAFNAVQLMSLNPEPSTQYIEVDDTNAELVHI